ncbi:MAG: clostripain-related cysteine peptidase [Candidatus Micrarchaeota archaeon]
MKYFSFGVVVLLAVLFSGCCQILDDFNDGFGEESNFTITPPVLPQFNEREWTYIVFMNGDNNLEMPMVMDFLEMESIGSTDKIAIVAQADRSTVYYSDDQTRWVGAKRFYIEKGNGEYITTEAIEELGDIDMGKGDTLADFVDWAVKKYPAKHYAVIMWDHGGGWTGMSQDESSGSSMTMNEFRIGLQKINQNLGKKIDVLVFDMCLMAQYDVMLEIQPYADYTVASEEVIPGYSFNYTSLLEKLNTEPNLTPKRLAEIEVEDYKAYYEDKDDATTLSAIDLSKIPAVETAFNEFIVVLTTKTDKWNDIADIGRYSEYYAVGTGEERIWSFADLYDFSRIAAAYNLADDEIQQKSIALQNSIDAAVIKNYYHSLHPRSHGLSFYFQPSKRFYQQYHEKDYINTIAYSKDQWRNFLQSYYSKENMGNSVPTLSDFKVSSTASLARPVLFSYKMTASNIANNQWAQFYNDAGTWKLARLIGQRGMTKLPDGSEVYGYPNGVGFGIGKSMPIEFGIYDGIKTVKASVEQRWPAEDAFVVNGIIKKKSGGQFEGQMVFSAEHGYAIQVLSQVEQNGQKFLAPVPIEDGDKFTPYIYVLDQNSMNAIQGQEITYTDANGLQLSWNVLNEKEYMVADIVTDLEGKTGIITGRFRANKQPQLIAPSITDLKKEWNCGILTGGLRVDKIFSLAITDQTCMYQDGTGLYNCTTYYSDVGSPHIYLHNVEKKENYKFVVSKGNNGKLWLYELAGTEPIVCISKGMAPPTVNDYKELYASIDDQGKDLDELQTSPTAVIGIWEDELTAMELKLNSDNSFQWKVGQTTITGTYRIEGETLHLDSLSPSTQYSTSFTYLCGKKRIVLYDQNMNEIKLKKQGSDISTSNVPIIQEQTGQGTQTPQTTPSAPTNLVGVWVNPSLLMTLWLKPGGFFEFSTGYYYDIGQYSVSGDSITFSSYYSGINQYRYSINGNILTLTGTDGTFQLQKYN